MKNKIYNTFDEAVADVPDGSTIMIPGFGGIGMPRNLIAALNRQGAKELTGVSNNAGNLDDKVDVSTLVEARQMKKMICAFTAPTHPSRITPFVEQYNNDEIEAELVPKGPWRSGCGQRALVSVASIHRPAWGRSLRKGRNIGKSTAGCTCWSTRYSAITRSYGLGRPTLSAISSSA